LRPDQAADASSARVSAGAESPVGCTIKGQKAKQPYAIAMKDGAPFGLAGRRRANGFGRLRSSPPITNELVAEIHDRTPALELVSAIE
jgi:hypothetical protein